MINIEEILAQIKENQLDRNQINEIVEEIKNSDLFEDYLSNKDEEELTPEKEELAAMMEEIRQGLMHGVDITYYAWPEFSAEQMREIRLGLEHNVDVLDYADPKYHAMKMQQVRLGLEHGVDLSPYIDDYDFLQLGQIRIGLEGHARVEAFAHPGLSSVDMAMIRLSHIACTNPEIANESEEKEKDLRFSKTRFHKTAPAENSSSDIKETIKKAGSVINEGSGIEENEEKLVHQVKKLVHQVEK